MGKVEAMDMKDWRLEALPCLVKRVLLVKC